MDDVDRKILAELQRDGRQTLTDLAGSVGISASPCHRRLRTLERDGVIIGYRALLDPTSLGFSFEAVVFVSMRHGDTDTVAAFEHAVAQVPEVSDAHRLFGDPDYVLRVVAHDLAAFTRLYDERLAALPGVDRLRSTPVMKAVVTDRPLPPFVGL